MEEDEQAPVECEMEEMTSNQMDVLVLMRSSALPLTPNVNTGQEFSSSVCSHIHLGI